MTEKELALFKQIKKYYSKYHLMPTMEYLKDNMHYTSKNAIYYLMKRLEDKGYLIHNKNLKKWNIIDFNQNICLKAINSNDYITINNEHNRDYSVFQIKNNIFIKYHIIKNDLLIIDKKKKIKDGDLGLFKINNQLEILEYHYKNDFYILNGKNTYYLNHVELIGVVIEIQRKKVLSHFNV